MVNYRLGIFNKYDVKEINLKEICDVKGLDKLDRFTCNFRCEEELKIYLVSKLLMYNEDINKKMHIMYKNCGTIKKLPVFYNDMKKYLDECYLRSKLMQFSKDINFLEKLARHYSLGSDKFNLQGVNVHDIRYYIAEVRLSGGEPFESNRLRHALDDLFIKALYSIVNKETGEVKENYRGRRDLALFIYKYESELKKQKEAKDSNSQKPVLDINKSDICEYCEQISFFSNDYQKKLK